MNNFQKGIQHMVIQAVRTQLESGTDPNVIMNNLRESVSKDILVPDEVRQEWLDSAEREIAQYFASKDEEPLGHLNFFEGYIIVTMYDKKKGVTRAFRYKPEPSNKDHAKEYPVTGTFGLY